jgi:very-short-patch-repair endonuclease/DNA-directed RNA polymerase subunit RPC12/RpoP
MCKKTQKKLCGKNECIICYNRSFASFEGLTPSGNLKVKYWYESNKLKPWEVFQKSENKYSFKCDKCPHIFEKAIYSIKTWCPYCSRQKLCKNKCEICFNNSFASFKELTPNGNLKVYCWDKSNKLTPREVFIGTEKKYNFECDKCFHIFETSPNNLTNRWCPYCSNKKLCKDDCNICFNNSFASFKGLTPSGNLKMNCWDKNNKLTPREIFKGTSNKYGFECDNCFHIFSKTISTVKNTWCPYCSSPPQLLCNNNCKLCYNNSFASFKGLTPSGNIKVDCWDKSNKNTPREVFKATCRKFYFKCDNCAKIFKSSLNNITGDRESWCPYCRNKTELMFKNYFEDHYNFYELKHQVKYDWCKIKRKLIYDFVIEEIKIIIEIDGEQHFSQISNWTSPEENLKRDILKMDKANQNGYTIIRILQEDIWFDKNNWKIELKKYLKKHITPTVIIIGCKIKYNKHVNLQTGF